MPNQNTAAEAALKKLGHHLRSGWAKKHPIQDKTLESVRDTVREQWEKEQQAKPSRKPSPPTKTQQRKPPEPDKD